MGKAKTAASVGDLVRAALRKVAAAEGEVQLTGKDGGVFATASGANKDAIAECVSAGKPLLAVVRSEGKAQFVALTPAGFERIAGDLPEDRVGLTARKVAAALPAGARVEFIQDAIRRTPLTAPELTPLLEEAVEAERREHETRVAVAAKRKAADDAAKEALERALHLFEVRRKNRLAALRREWEAEGGDPDELTPHKGGGTAHPEREGPAPATTEEKEFRRHSAAQFAAAWRAAWDAKKDEARDYVESAMWNIRGLKLLGEAGGSLAFDGTYHECPNPVSTGERVRVVRPGWVLTESHGDYVPLKVLVATG